MGDFQGDKRGYQRFELMVDVEHKDGLEELLPPIPTEQTEVVNVDFIKGTITDKIVYEAETGIPKFLRELAKYAKKHKVVSATVMMINEENHVDWMSVVEDEHHLALAALCLDDIKEELKSKLFGEDEEIE